MPFSPLTPGPEQPAHELLAAVRPRERAGPDRPFVYVNFVSTADGRAALDGSTRDLGTDADLDLLLELRALSDAMLLGPATVRAEGYGRLLTGEDRRARRVAAGLPEDPLAVLLSRRGAIPWEAGLFQAPEQPVLVYSGVDVEVPDVPAPVEMVVLADPRPEVAMADLRARGVLALGCEGGPTLLGALVAAGVVDELFLTIAPLLTGDEEEPNIVAGGRLPEPAPMELLSVVQSGSELFLRYGL
jgi:riboflavin biosynthesis pyrimidine reductase